MTGMVAEHSVFPFAGALNIVVITLFPEIFYQGPLQISLVGRAQTQGIWGLRVVDLRSYGIGKHRIVDDPVYGGGAGMILRPDVVDAALQQAVVGLNNPHFVYLSPRGTPLTQSQLSGWCHPPQDLVLLCGRYEGVDQRVLEHWKFQEISIGDFVVCGGEIPALLLIEGVVRLLEGVVGNPESLVTESFQSHILEHPQYTRPSVWQGMAVPPVLLSGHHEHIRRWRQDQSEHWTEETRPDLWKKHKNRGTVKQET